MVPKRKPGLLHRRHSQSKSIATTDSYTVTKQPKHQSSRAGEIINSSRQWITTLLVQLACWDALLAALTVLLAGGFRHD
jgi:hypothetical protein